MIAKSIKTPLSPAPFGPYSQGYRVDKLLFTAGQAGYNPVTRKIAGQSIEEQTKQALDNIKSIVEASGCRMENVVKTTVFLRKAEDFEAMNRVYSTYFTNNPPARTAVVCDFVFKEMLIEIEAIAWAP